MGIKRRAKIERGLEVPIEKVMKMDNYIISNKKPTAEEFNFFAIRFSLNLLFLKTRKEK